MTGVKFSYPVTKEMTATHIGYLLLRNLSAESINCYLSGLRCAHLIRGELPGSLRTEFTSALIRGQSNLGKTTGKKKPEMTIEIFAE